MFANKFFLYCYSTLKIYLIDASTFAFGLNVMTLSNYSFPTDRARELFKSLRIREVFQFECKFLSLGLEFLVVTSQWRHVFAPLWLRLPGPGCQLNEPFFISSFFGN